MFGAPSSIKIDEATRYLPQSLEYNGGRDSVGRGEIRFKSELRECLEHPTLPRPWVFINKKGEGSSPLTFREGRDPCLEEKIKGGRGWV